VLGKQQYRSAPVIATVTSILARLAQSPPTARVFTFSYGQTPASVANFASYANSKANSIDAVETTIPVVLLVLGVVSGAVGLAIYYRDRRRLGTGPRAMAQR